MAHADLRSLHKIDFNVAKALEHVTNEVENCMARILRCISIIMWLREEFTGSMIRLLCLTALLLIHTKN